MTKPVVLFAVTSFTGSVCREFLPSLIESLGILGQRGIASQLSIVPGDPYLSKARNRCAYEFLAHHLAATHLFFLDDDLGWQPDAVARLLDHDVDLVAGCYPKKTDKGEWPCQIDTDSDGNPHARGPLWRAKLAPTGFMCIKRTVVERMAASAMMYVDTSATGWTTLQWNIFDMGCFLSDGSRPIDQAGQVGQFWGEDYYFCRKWRDMGGEIWIDPDIMFTHRGSMAWAGNFRQKAEEFFAERAVATAQTLVPETAAAQ